MKYAFLVAWREYSESAKAKGFWLGIFLMPAILFLSIQAPIWLEEKATPVRYYVLVDQSGTLVAAVESALERNHQKRVFEALGEYARKNSSPSGPPTVVGTPAAGEASAGNIDQPALRSLEAFVKEGGKDSYLERLRPYLKPGTPPFQEPRRQFKQVELPADINPEAGLPDIAQKLRPYLRDQKQIEADGQKINLSAAILIPDDIGAQIIRPQNTMDQVRVAPPAAEAGPRTSPSPYSPSVPHPIQFWSVNASDPRLRDDLERAINSEIRRREYLARGMDAAAIRQVEQTYAPFASQIGRAHV